MPTELILYIFDLASLFVTHTLKFRTNEPMSVTSYDASPVKQLWKTTKPLTNPQIRKLRRIHLQTLSMNQGYVDFLENGSWSWFEIALCSNADGSGWGSSTSQRVKTAQDGRELSWLSHHNVLQSSVFSSVGSSSQFGPDHEIWKDIEQGDTFGIRLCAQYPAWQCSIQAAELRLWTVFQPSEILKGAPYEAPASPSPDLLSTDASPSLASNEVMSSLTLPSAIQGDHSRDPDPFAPRHFQTIKTVEFDPPFILTSPPSQAGASKHLLLQTPPLTASQLHAFRGMTIRTKCRSIRSTDASSVVSSQSPSRGSTDQPWFDVVILKRTTLKKLLHLKPALRTRADGTALEWISHRSADIAEEEEDQWSDSGERFGPEHEIWKSIKKGDMIAVRAGIEGSAVSSEIKMVQIDMWV
ncbi:hypothetical protein SISSUDRAFT_1038417 [Sistotremastrum suecicum HHB10207 ss-3]|uniref:Uncharacterized protein n=1 Tax=Sistotremastrum suecicum HHB10207 ss-3 TaxID=1314776 RepID=A0A165WRY0_9AGAM|nr:hypothetical protein SISSUDRAFT_1038417 [Sistotremastrum suecicum HHB10207 ss-3]